MIKSVYEETIVRGEEIPIEGSENGCLAEGA